MPRQPKQKPRPAGRPKLDALTKSTTVLVRMSAPERERLEAAAKAKGQTISQWLRSTINANV
jgi:predicted DNA-binding protein